MEGSDWKTCKAVVFRIYRRRGRGALRVGDEVGIYYPNDHLGDEDWFSMTRGHGHRESCPGRLSSTYGFSGPEKWARCGGEVFEIYARGKAVGSTITSHDHVTIYNKVTKKWVGLAPRAVVQGKTCPGSVLPPADDKYEICQMEVFEIWKRPSQ